MAFTHKFVTRPERARETAISVCILVVAFAVACFCRSLPNHLAIGIALLLVSVCAIYNICLQVRNSKRAIPTEIDTAGRWICTKKTLQEMTSYHDYYCEILRSEHGKGPNPIVTIVDPHGGPVVEMSFLVKPNETGDIRVYYPPARLSRIGIEPPVKLSITGD